MWRSRLDEVMEGGRTELICLVGPVQELFRHLFDIQHWHRPAGAAARTQRPSAPEISRTSSSPTAAGGATFEEGASLSLSILFGLCIYFQFLFVSSFIHSDAATRALLILFSFV